MPTAVKITDALVITGQGTDKVYLTTDIFDPIGRNEKLSLYFQTPKGEGVKFVQQHIGIERVAVVERNVQTSKFGGTP